MIQINENARDCPQRMRMIPRSVTALLTLAVSATLASCGNDGEGQTGAPAEEISEIRVLPASAPPSITRYSEHFRERNCGRGAGSREIAVSELVKKNVSLGERALGGAEGTIEIPAALKVRLKGEIESSYRSTYEQALATSQKIQRDIPPWTVMDIEVEFERKEYSSEATFEKESTAYKVPYRFVLGAVVPRSVRVEYEDCPGKPSEIDIRPAQADLELGESVQLRATLFDTMNNVVEQEQFVWASSNNNVATVTRTGLVEAVGPGMARITVTAEELAGAADIRVTQTPVRLRIEPSEVDIAYGESFRLHATVLDRNGNVISSDVRWSSEDEDVVSVTPEGLVQGRWIGRGTVTAAFQDLTGSALVEVDVPRLAFPERTITLIVPFDVGGKSDQMARQLSASLGRRLGEEIAVINLPGRQGAIGWQRAAAAAPDGHTMTIYNAALGKAPGVALADFEPVAMFARGYGLLVPKGTPPKAIMVLEYAVREAASAEKFQTALHRVGETPFFAGSKSFHESLSR